MYNVMVKFVGFFSFCKINKGRSLSGTGGEMEKGTECYLEKGRMDRKRKEQIEAEHFSFFILSALLSPFFVSSSALCSEQGSQGHLAGCEVWGGISIRIF